MSLQERIAASHPGTLSRHHRRDRPNLCGLGDLDLLHDARASLRASLEPLFRALFWSSFAPRLCSWLGFGGKASDFMSSPLEVPIASRNIGRWSVKRSTCRRHLGDFQFISSHLSHLSPSQEIHDPIDAAAREVRQKQAKI